MFATAVAVVLSSLLLRAQANALHKAPELAFTIPGQGERLLSQYRGKVVGLEFILTTCPHCQIASHLMTRLQSEYGSRGFQALDLAINGLDEGRSAKEADALVQGFSSTYQVGFPVGWVPREQMIDLPADQAHSEVCSPAVGSDRSQGRDSLPDAAGRGRELNERINDPATHRRASLVTYHGAVGK